MTFLAAVIALVMYRLHIAVAAVQQDNWFARWRDRVAGWQLAPWPGLALAVLAPTLVASAVLDALEDMLFGLPWIMFSVVLLLYAFGRGDLQRMQARYRLQCQNGDFEAALHGLPASPGGAVATEPASEWEVHRAVQRALFYEAYQRWFAVLFFLVIAGPAGALGYRLVQLCRDDTETPVVERTLLVLDWVPARLLAATFGAAGDFVRCRALLVDAALDAGRAIDEVIYAVGAAAAGGASAPGDEGFCADRALAEHAEGVDLIARSAVIWVAGLALLVLLSD